MEAKGLDIILNLLRWDYLWNLFLYYIALLFRIIPVVYLFPPLGGKIIPTSLKIVLALGIASLVVLFTFETETVTILKDPLIFILIAIKEVIVGFGIGYISSLIFYGYSIAGNYIDILRGASASEIFATVDPEESFNITGNFGLQLGLVIFILINGPGYFIDAFIRSFVNLPVYEWKSSVSILELLAYHSIRFSTVMFTTGFALAFPVIVVSLLSDLVVGLIGKSTPAVGGYFLSLPLKVLISLTILLFSISLWVPIVEDGCREIIKWLNWLF